MMNRATMEKSEKIIKVLQANKAAAKDLQTRFEAQGKKELAKQCFGEWLAYDMVLAMLTDEAEAEEYYKIWFGEDAKDV